jgi:Fuc2NAc and GlcNAc transferase
VLIALVAAVLSALAVAGYRRLALRRRWLAEPSGRGLHQAATPSGAGLAVFLALGLLALVFPGGFPGLYAPLLGLALALAVLGFADDLWQLSAPLRLVLYAAAVLVAAAWLLAPGGSGLVLPALLPVGFAMLAFTNFYNFMDGIDGLAALQCVLAAGFAGAAAVAAEASPAYAGFCFALAGVHAGLLLFNRPPAVLFMGDAGSIPTGFLLAALAVAGTVREGLPPALLPVLCAVFLSDAGVTLLLRWRRGEPLAEAHRDHLYQRLARRWHSHARVDLLFVAVQLGWLSPLAWLMQARPALAPLLLLCAYGPVLFVMVKFRHLQ